MGAHIFLVSEANFSICVQRGVYGCVTPSKEWNRAEIVAGLFSIQPNDLVFFYVKNRGIYGLWKVVTDSYFDETKLWPDENQSFPYRFSFEPAVGHFPVPISLSDVLDLRDKGRIWTFDLNPVQQKNQYKITINEARELLRLLLRNNPLRQPPKPIVNAYTPSLPTPIGLDLTPTQNGRVRYEGWLNAWFIQALAKGRLKDLLGDFQEFLNLVPTTFNKVMDIFLTHVTTIDSIEVLHKFTCIELKADRASEQDLTQLLRYEDWLARRLAAGDAEMVQSVLVASRFTDGVIQYVRERKRIEEKSVRLLTYRVSPGRQDIELIEV